MRKIATVVIAGLIFSSGSVFAHYDYLSSCLQTQKDSCDSYGTNPNCHIETYTDDSSFDIQPNYYQIVLGTKCVCGGVTGWQSGCATGPVYTYNGGPPPNANNPNSPRNRCGSIVNVDMQSVAEQIPIAGVPFTLTYSSLWAASRAADYKIRFPVVGSSPPSGVTDFDVTLKILGIQFDNQTITNSTDELYSYDWNGNDNGGNPVLGSVAAEIIIKPDGAGIPIPFSYQVGTLKAKLLGFGGWMPSNYHFYDNNRKILYRGDGTTLSVKAMTLAGGNFLVPDKEGSVAYEFSSAGRHLYTKTGLLGTTIATFNYSTYSGVSLLTSITEPFSRTTTFTRNGSGVLTSITSPDGIVTNITISGGLLQEVENANSESYLMTYKTSTDLLETFTKPEGQVNTFSYNSDGLLTQDSHSGGYEFDISKTFTSPANYSLSETTSMSRVTTSSVSNTLLFGGGSYNRSVSMPSGASRSQSQAAQSSSSTEFGLTSTIYMADDGRFGSALQFPNSVSTGPRTMSVAQSVSLNTPSDPFSIHTMTVTSTLDGHDTVLSYHGTGSIFSITSAAGRVRTIDIDAYERPTYDKWATDNAITYSYTNDKLTGIDQGTRSTVLSYNGSGALASVTNDLSQTTGYTYDSALRLRYVTLPDSRVIEYTYDANGNIASITPPGRDPHVFVPNGHELTGEYQPPALTGPLVTNTVYTYNDDKQLIEIERPDSQTITYNYGSTTGNLDSIVTPDGTYNFGFDTTSEKINSASTPGGVSNSLSFTYGKLTGDTLTVNSKTFSYAKSLNSLLQKESETVTPYSGSASQVDFTYDYDELLTQAEDLTITRNSATGRIDATAIGLVTDVWTYNSYGELTDYVLKFNSSNVFAYTITRDDLGRVDTKSETVQAVTHTFDYTYDSAGRLNDVDKDSAAYSNYSFDSNSNRTSGNIGGASFTAVYDQQDRMTDFNLYDYTYTVNGELSTKVNTLTTETWTYTYDVLGNLKSVELPNADLVEYEADGFNRRTVRKFNSSVTDYYLWEENHLIAQLDSSGAFKARFVYGTKDHVPDYMIVGADTYRIVTDHLGSVRMVIKTDDGTVAQKMEYNELGRVLSDTSPGFQPFGYAGGLYDTDTKLVRFGARDYDAETGRWTSKDPIRFGGGDTNLYGYVVSNPINWIDPEGTNPWLVRTAIGVGLACLLAPDSCKNTYDNFRDWYRCLGNPDCLPTREQPYPPPEQPQVPRPPRSAPPDGNPLYPSPRRQCESEMEATGKVVTDIANTNRETEYLRG